MLLRHTEIVTMLFALALIMPVLLFFIYHRFVTKVKTLLWLKSVNKALVLQLLMAVFFAIFFKVLVSGVFASGEETYRDELLLELSTVYLVLWTFFYLPVVALINVFVWMRKLLKEQALKN